MFLFPVRLEKLRPAPSVRERPWLHLGSGPAKQVPATLEGCLLRGALPAPSFTGSREVGKQL